MVDAFATEPRGMTGNLPPRCTVCGRNDVHVGPCPMCKANTCMWCFQRHLPSHPDRFTFREKVEAEEVARSYEADAFSPPVEQVSVVGGYQLARSYSTGQTALYDRAVQAFVLVPRAGEKPQR